MCAPRCRRQDLRDRIYQHAGWGNAVTILPEMMYRQFGDEEALPRQYESMKLFVEAEIRKMGKKNLWIGPSLGDWLAMGKGIAWQAMHNNPVSNAFIVHDLKVISETAERLGKREDAARYRRQLAATTDAYIKKFVSKNGIVAKDYQSAYIMALKFVLPEGELREMVKKNFVANIRKNGLQTGFFATEHLLPLLVEAGEQKLAYDVLLQENCPGWMYQVKCGATTTWERWDALKPDGTVNEEKMAGSGENMVSFNHYAFGSVGSFTINISWESDQENRALQNCILHLIRTSAWEAYPEAIFPWQGRSRAHGGTNRTAAISGLQRRWRR